MSQDELHTAIRVARKIYREGSRPVDETLVVLCALVRAVELLAERQDKPAADKRIEELEREQRECLSLITDSLLVMPGRTLTWAVGDLIDLHGTAKKKVDELQKEVADTIASRDQWTNRAIDAETKIGAMLTERAFGLSYDGKTPGQVSLEGRTFARIDAHGLPVNKAVQWSMLEDDERAFEEIGALAVLRAFGQPSQTTQANAAEALRGCLERVRERLGEEERSFGGEHLVVDRPTWTAIIDAELAKLEARPAPNSDHAHELGSCSFCDKPPPDTSTESGLPDAVLLEKP